MSTIGYFKRNGSNDFIGEIITLGLQVAGVKIVEGARSTAQKDNGPSHLIFRGKAEIGAAWTRTSENGQDYLSLKLDDPSLPAPIYANLVDVGEDEHNLIWSRKPANGR